MQPYSYRDSGIEWLGKIPSHWKVKRIKDLVDLRSGEAITALSITEDGDYPVYGGNGLRGYTSAYTHEGQRILIGRQGALCGNVNYASGKFWASEHAVVATPVRLHDTFWFGELLRAMNLNQYSNAAAQPGLAVEKIKNLNISLPPIEEQRAIAGFLDEACGKIDAAIQVKREQSDKITKHYQARVYEVIKSGLHAGVQTKDSGSAWLGKVPQHWKVKKLKYLADILRGKFNHRPRNDPEFYNGDYPFIQTGDVSRADKYIQSYSQTLNERGYAVSKEFPAGTLTMTIAANIGDVAILNFAACFPDSVVGFKPHHEVELEFLYYLLLALRQDVMSTAILTTQLNLNIVRVGSTLAVIPPKSEQQEIVTYLNNLKQKTDDLSEGLNEQIRILEAYKKSLVHECVTGKKQVWQGDGNGLEESANANRV